MVDSITPEIQPTSLKSAFDKLLAKHSGYETRIKELVVTEQGYPDLKVRFLYPAFRQSEVMVAALAKMLTSRVTRFCMTRESRREAKEEDSHDDTETQAVDNLNREARSLFIKVMEESKRSGEGGELLLYVLIEALLYAPLIVSKMRLKTNTQMPVHGTDGIHATWNEENSQLIIYFGESKIHSSFSSAIEDAINSISEIASNLDERRDREIELISNFADLDGFPDEFKALLKKYLHPYKYEEANNRIEKFAVLVGFDLGAFKRLANCNPSEMEDKFRELYKGETGRKLKAIQERMQEKGIHHSMVELFVFAFPSVEDFRQEFQDALNG